MHCRTITANLLTKVRHLVEFIKYLAKPKASLEAYISISQTTQTLTSSKTVISSSIYSVFYFGSILRSNRYLWSTVLSYVGNSAGRCGGIKTNVKTKYIENRKCLSIIELIKGGYVLCRGLSIQWKRIVAAIESFQIQMGFSFPFLRANVLQVL